MERHAALLSLVTVAVHVDAIEGDVRWRCRGRVRAYLDQRLVAQLRHAIEVEELDDVAVRAGIGAQERRGLVQTATTDDARNP